MTQNMERINSGANGRRENPKVKGRNKGGDRSGKGKKEDKARNTPCPKKIVPFFYFFFSRCPVCGEWCNLH
jgi:hypothetical protein